KTILLRHRLQFPIYWEARLFASTGAPNVFAPIRERAAALFHGARFVVGDVIHFATKSIQSGHAVALGARQQNERQREIRRALPRYGSAFLHAAMPYGGSSGMLSLRIGGSPPVSAKVGFRRWRRFRLLRRSRPVLSPEEPSFFSPPAARG